MGGTTKLAYPQFSGAQISVKLRSVLLEIKMASLRLAEERWRLGGMLRRTLLVVSLFAVLGPSILAQDASLSGHVFDQSQLVVPGAVIEVIDRSTSLKRSTQTNAAGLYSLPDLPPASRQEKKPCHRNHQPAE